MIGAQICELVNQGMSAAQVAEALDVSEVAVKSAVAASGTETPALDFSDEDLAAAIDGISQVARYGENERNRVQCGIFIYEVKKGLKKAKADDQKLPITQINQLIIAANDDIARFASRKSVGRGDRITSESVQDAQVADCGAPDSAAAPEIPRREASGATQIESSQETTAGTLANF